MARRKLNDEEKAICLKSIERLKRRNNYLEGYYLPKTELEIKIGLEKAYMETRENYEKTMREWKEELANNKKQIEILNEQIKKGVKPK